MALYHYKLGIPKVFNLPDSKIMLRYTKHALRAAEDDRNGLIELPRFLDPNQALLVEAEILIGRYTKGVWRIDYSNDYDLVLVVQDDGVVRTVWLNHRSDKHYTLDTSRYAIP